VEALARELATKRPRGPAAARKEKLSRRALREERSFYTFILPWLLGFIFLSAAPLLTGLYISFTNYDGLNWLRWDIVGLDNYKDAFQSMDVLVASRNTLIYAVVVVPVGLALSFLLAIMLNQSIKGQGLFRTLYYIPSILPVTGSVWAWRLLMGKNAGLVNYLLSFIRPGTGINWIVEQYFLVLYTHAWWHAGGGMVIFLAGLQGIPPELYEASMLDGANRISTFFKITLPLMTPVLFFQLVMGIIGSLQILDVPILLSGGGGMAGSAALGRERYLYMVYQYSQIFDFQRFGFGVALSWLLFVVVLVATAVVVFSARFWVYYEVAMEGEAR
jgi:multiple sugar transport system permease protein